MSKREMTLVYYHVPEDKDDPNCPNVFGVPQSKNTLRLEHIYEAFPLKGSYLFRFKYNNQGSSVWLDLPTLQSKIPLFKDRVIMKATRVSWNDSKLHSQYKEKNPKAQTVINDKQQTVDFFNQGPEERKIVPEVRKESAPTRQQDLLSHESKSSPQVDLLLDQPWTSQPVDAKVSPKGIDLLHQMGGDLI